MPMTIPARIAARSADALVYNRGGLAAWHAALANRAAAPAKALWLGDSITEGSLAPSYGARWVDRALAVLRQNHPTPGVAGGFGYLPAMFGGGTANQGPQGQPYASLTGGVLGSDPGFGLGGRCAIFAAVGDGATYNVTASSVALHYVTAGSTGTMAVQIDGGAVQTINTVGPLAMAQWSSGPLTPGPHTIRVTRSAGGSVYYAGMVVFNGDEAAGVQGHEAGHFGYTTTNAAGYGSAVWQAAGSIAPQLAAIALGTNDYSAQLPIATFRANLNTVIASLRGASPGLSIALLTYGRRGDVAAQPIGWDQYVQACYDLADADAGGLNGRSGVAVIDLSPRLPWAATSGVADPLGLYATDRVHLTAKGHLAVGEMVGAALRL